MAPTGIRDRFRAQMVDEIKQIALRQLAEGGPQALSVNAIAKELGVSGPALYRYFANRDALLTELILDAYADLAAALLAAEPGLAPLADSYRAWATAHPHRYRLLFGSPLPGYEAHDERLVAAAQQSMDVLFERIPAGPSPVPELAAQIAEWARRRGRAGVDPAAAQRALTAWSRLHGLVTLEIEGNYASMGLDADLLFAAEVAALQ
jgi:AcrR family transcriptional regulator